LIATLRQSHGRLASLAEAISEDFLTHISYADAWTVAQVFSHLGSGAEIAVMLLEAALGGPPLDQEAVPPIWDTWNAKTPQHQAADCLAADDAHVKRLEGLTDAELAGISYHVFGMTLDAAGLIGLRLSEHAVHTWDIAVTADPEAVVAPAAVDLLVPQLGFLAERTGRTEAGPLRVRLRGTHPEVDFLLDRRAVAARLRAARRRAHPAGPGHRSRGPAGPHAGGVPGDLAPSRGYSASVTSAAASAAQPQDRVMPAPPWP
jgi:uncharacterized protein (TIGR03083 family)